MKRRRAALGGIRTHDTVLYQLSYQLVGVRIYNTTQHKGKPQTTVLWHSILSLTYGRVLEQSLHGHNFHLRLRREFLLEQNVATPLCF